MFGEQKHLSFLKIDAGRCAWHLNTLNFPGEPNILTLYVIPSNAIADDADKNLDLYDIQLMHSTSYFLAIKQTNHPINHTCWEQIGDQLNSHA